MSAVSNTFASSASSINPASVGSARRLRSLEIDAEAKAATTSPLAKIDLVDISPEALAASAAESQGGGIRKDLVSRVRAQIAAGDYESEDQLNVVADRLLKAISEI